MIKNSLKVSWAVVFAMSIFFVSCKDKETETNKEEDTQFSIEFEKWSGCYPSSR
jgi:hypothetical protein